jgi:uncharacterized SAM-binding protein YcdF (DUF218 family)
MLFLISKVVGFLLLPSNLIAFVGALGLAGTLIGWRRVGSSLMGIAIIALIVAGWSPLGMLALQTLETRFPPPRIEGPVAGIVSLGGAVDVHITKDRDAPALNDAGERVTAVAALAQSYPDARIVLSGGAGDLHDTGTATESAVAKRLLVAMGLPAERIELEERSRNTCENAAESLAVAKPEAGETWLLVTSASHMPRAVACFRAIGFPVVAFPVDYRTTGAAWSADPIGGWGCSTSRRTNGSV